MFWNAKDSSSWNFKVAVGIFAEIWWKFRCTLIVIEDCCTRARTKTKLSFFNISLCAEYFLLTYRVTAEEFSAFPMSFVLTLS